MSDAPLSPLEEALAGLRQADVPAGLSGDIMARIRREPRWLGLGRREWAFVGGSLSVFGVAVQMVVSVATHLLQ